MGAKIEALLPDVPPGKVAVHENQMEYTFVFSAPILDALNTISLSPLAEKREMIVRYMRTVMVVKVPSRPAPGVVPTEIMLPLEKGKHAMIHSGTNTFTQEQIELCAQLHKLNASSPREQAEKKEKEPMPLAAKAAPAPAAAEDGKALSPEELTAQLEALGARLFFPPTEAKGSVRKLMDHNVEHLWSGIAGYAKVKAAVKQTITLPLLRPDLFAKMAQLARGNDDFKCSTAALFTGPPGVGKTSMAKVAAHAAAVPLVYVPVEGVMSKYYGEAEQRLGKIFELTRQLHRAVLFLDELDAFAGSRDQQMHEATRRILSVLLRQLDGLDNEKAKDLETCPFIVTVGATNRPTDLDSALLSRFNQCIEFTLPTAEERAAIFGTYAAVLTPEELASVAEAGTGFAGRDIVEVCHHAERLWLYQLLSDPQNPCFGMSLDELKPPPAAIYLQAVAQHKAGNGN